MFHKQCIEIFQKVQQITNASILSLVGGLVLTNITSTPPEPYFSLKHVCTLKQMTLTSLIFLCHLH